jgi:hypothetical protein
MCWWEADKREAAISLCAGLTNSLYFILGVTSDQTSHKQWELDSGYNYGTLFRSFCSDIYSNIQISSRPICEDSALAFCLGFHLQASLQLTNLSISCCGFL